MLVLAQFRQDLYWEHLLKRDKSSLIGGFRYSFPNIIHKIFPSYSEKLGTIPDIIDGFIKFHSIINPDLKLSLWTIVGNSNTVFKQPRENYTSTNNISYSFTVEVQNALNRENILERHEYYSIDPVVTNQVMRVFVYKYILSF